MSGNRIKGFTLIELMVVIAIVAILAALAFPSFESSMRSNRVATTTNEMMAALSLARSEAMRSPSGSGVCASINGSTCGGTWDDGWIVWIEGNGTGVCAPGGAGDRVVRSYVTNNKLALSGSATQLCFNPRGRVADNVIRTLTLMPDTCPTGQNLRRDLTIRPTGQVRVERGTCT